jgi:uncharacterized protein YlxW (UPF0749 family)
MSAPRRPDASMSLLNDIIRQPIDGDYASARATRTGGPVSRPQRLTRSGLVLVVATFLGLVLSGAVVNLRAPTAAVQASRQLLIDQIDERTSEASALSADIGTLSDEIAKLQSDALAARDPALLAEVDRYELVSGATAVAGPGLVVVLTDAPSDGAQTDPATRVQDMDLQLLVNGLWAAGAEAVAVNGERVTSLSAIRNVGPAILVDLVPLASPYTVSAIGDPQAMQTAFARGSASTRLALLSSYYGISVSIKAATNLVLPGSGNAVLRSAQVPDVASSAQPDVQEATP